MVLKEQAASFFEVTPRTVDNYIENFSRELRRNGYEVVKGNRLKTLKLAIQAMDVDETDFVNIKAPMIGVFDFRAFLNLAIVNGEMDSESLKLKILEAISNGNS